MTGVYETPARMVRTGQVIAFPWDGYRSRLEVEIVHHETFEHEDGRTEPVVRFTGWSSRDGHVEQVGTNGLDVLLLVVEDRRGHCFGTLTGDLPEEEA